MKAWRRHDIEILCLKTKVLKRSSELDAVMTKKSSTFIMECTVFPVPSACCVRV